MTYSLDTSSPGPVTRPLLRYHGGKWRIAPRIIAHFPPHRVYVEPFGGGASVLLRKPRSYAEVYNDLDGEIVNLFRVARDCPEQLVRAVTFTPFAREEFNLAFESAEDPVERARRTLLRSFAGFGGNLTRPNRDSTPQRTGFRCYTGLGRRGNVYSREWADFPARLRAIMERIRGVFIEQRDACVLIERHDSRDTLFYVDPPYPHSTRSAACGGTHRGYRFEMNDDQHRELAAALYRVKGHVVISGYACDLYDRELYPHWQRVAFLARADGGRQRTEVLWIKP